ncbi:MAG: porin [Pseudomonadota bacterium]
MMRWVLLSGTAWVALALGADAQDISISGTAEAGLSFDSDADDEITFENDIDFVITGSGQSDTGFEFGAFIELDEDTTGGGTGPNNGVEDAEVFFSGRFGTFTLGDIDPATDGFGINDIGFSGLGVDDVAEQFRNATAGADVLYTYSAGGFTIVASAEVGDQQSLGLSAEYATGPINLGIGYVDDSDEDNSAVSLKAGYSFGRVAVSGLYSDWSEGSQGYGVDVTVDTGPARVTAAWAQASGTAADAEDGVGDAYGIGVDLPMGGGLTLSGGLGRIETDAVGDGAKTVADFGVTMSF